MTDGYNAEEVEYFTEVVRDNLDYWHLGDWLCQDGRDGYAEADEIVGFIVNEICSLLPYNRKKLQQALVLNRNFYSSYIHFRDKYVQNPATCLPHIVIENCLKLLKTTLSQVRKSGCFSAVFAHYSKPTEVFWSIQFPYGSPYLDNKIDAHRKICYT